MHLSRICIVEIRSALEVCLAELIAVLNEDSPYVRPAELLKRAVADASYGLLWQDNLVGGERHGCAVDCRACRAGS